MPPRHATPRDPSRPTDGAAGALVAFAHGRPWQSYQRATADLIGERVGPAYAYPVVIILWPRQCGKTTFAFDVAQGRCIEQPDYRAAYTAQTGHVTTERFGERLSELSSTALARVIRQRRSQGTERMSFPRGSFLKAFPPKDGALRGSALDLVVVDEAQEIDAELGERLDQTILPTFTTRRRRQLILIGTAGTARSAFLRRYLEAARDGAPGIALIEYGFPADADPLDPAVWAAHHPGLAAGLTDDDALRSALAVMGSSGFAREYGNVWQVSGDAIIPAEVWTAAAALATPAGGSPVLGIDVSHDRTVATIVSCWPATDGRRVVELIEQCPPIAAAARVIELQGRYRADVWVDGTGPATTVVAELHRHIVTRAGRPSSARWLHVLRAGDYTAACPAMLDGLTAGTIGHHRHPAMDAAAAGAARRLVGDGWVWARRSSAVDIGPLVAGTVAAHGLGQAPPAPLRPVAFAG